MKWKNGITAGWIAWIIGGLGVPAAPAQSWPTFRHDNRRSGVTENALSFPLHLRWVRHSQQPPQPAWTGPAKWDAWAGNSGLQSMRNFDPCFYVTASDGRVFFGSSVDDAVHALDADSGKEQWVFFTGAAVRLPPTIDQQRAYFGSDDGHVYCCHAGTGKLVWVRQAAPEKERITSNRKIISLWPVRTGVLIQQGRAIFASSLVPWEPSLLWCVDAATGRATGQDCYRNSLSGMTLQGALLASTDRLYAPQGRSAPIAFDFSSGKLLGAIGEAGGVFCILTEDEMLLAGPPHQKESDDQIRIADGKTSQRTASFSGTNRIVVAGSAAWIPAHGKLKRLDRAVYVAAQRKIDQANEELKQRREKKLPTEAVQQDLEQARHHQQTAWQWEVECPHPSGLIKAGPAILAGLQNEVRAYAADDGKLLWSAKVEGLAHGLAVADGQLYVSTSLGHIYAFGVSR
ncbi:MAG: PQQ-binding-like beta-propeller repeat protein [Pirellulales bacterium]|nr:PQQ-binding-like beta-propeller repeat protein [Pirellulales bacterium]